MKSTVLISTEYFQDFLSVMKKMGVSFLGVQVEDQGVFSVSIEGPCIPDAPQVEARLSRSHEGNTSTLKIEWIPVASDSDDQGEDE